MDASSCLFCYRIYNDDDMIFFYFDTFLKIIKCEECESSFCANIISFRNYTKKTHFLRFFAKKGKKVQKFENCIEFSKINKEDFDSFAFQFEEEKEPKNLDEEKLKKNEKETPKSEKNRTFVSSIEILERNIQEAFCASSHKSVVIEKNFLKNTVLQNVYIEYNEKKDQYKKFQAILYSDIEWSPENNKFFPNKLDEKIESFFLCIKKISSLTSKWKTPIKIPKFVLYHIVSLLYFFYFIIFILFLFYFYFIFYIFYFFFIFFIIFIIFFLSKVQKSLKRK